MTNFSYPTISIVTPSFNQAAYLEETIRSVLDQNYPNLEYFVIDGGSTDGSLEIIRRYAHRLTHWVSEADEGQADAINKGIQMSSGQLLGWLNSDDCLLPGALQQIGVYMQTHPQAQVVCGFRRFIVGQQRTGGRHVHLSPDRFTLQRRCYLAQETVYFRRSLWQTVGGLDISYQFGLDYDLWQRILAEGVCFSLLPSYLGEFRLHPVSKTSSWQRKRSEELGRIYARYLGTAKTEAELYAEISPAWKWRMILLHYAAHLRLLSTPRTAQWMVAQLALPD